jgi:predicted ATPase
MNTVQLNSSLIKSRPFLINTNWSVITGAPCSGKTSLLKELSKKGYKWYPEIARVYIEQEKEKGRTLKEIRANEGEFQKGLVNTKLDLEKNSDTQSIIFFDRAMPDSITYYRVGNLDPNFVLDDCFNYKYKKVFIFDRLEYVLDGARTEDDTTASFLDKWLEDDYKSLGYDVIRVPVMSINDRVDFILSNN